MEWVVRSPVSSIAKIFASALTGWLLHLLTGYVGRAGSDDLGKIELIATSQTIMPARPLLIEATKLGLLCRTCAISALRRQSACSLVPAAIAMCGP